jgi:hypothetical protein
MSFERLPETVQTLYAELLDQAIRARAEMRDLPETGAFVSKRIRGRTYWYLQRLEGQRKRQIYLGRESAFLLNWISEVQKKRELVEPDTRRRAELVSMLVSGGAAAESAPIFQVIQVLADAKMFELGGVLVGTQAFTCYGNMMGVRLEGAHRRTLDIDVAHDPAVEISLSEKHARVDLLKKLQETEPRFFAVPALDPRKPSTSFKVRGRDLRVDFLTPGRRNREGPVVVPAFGIAATPLLHLDYLMERVTHAVILGGSGVLVEVPVPARFSLHKLWTSQERPMAESIKTLKDIAQASFLLEVLLSDRPGELVEAWEATRHRGGMRRGIASALRSADDDLARRFRQAVGMK